MPRPSDNFATSVVSDPARWQAVLHRDPAAEGRFFYAVESTHIYCRPTCPSRRPRPENVHFFATTTAAEAAGFRACHRCRPQDDTSPRAAWLAAVREHLDQNTTRRITLDELARFAGVTPTHLQRAFAQAYGLSPRAYQSAHRAKSLAANLTSSATVTRAVYDSGYDSPGPAYQDSARTLGMAPQRIRKGAAGEAIVYTVVPTPLGKLLAAATGRGLCRVAFADTSGSLTMELQNLRAAFHAADLLHAAEKKSPPTHREAAKILSAAVPALQQLASGEHAKAIPVDLRGTAFQQKVWHALQQIPKGETRSYTQLATELGQPAAARAVARACATNSVALAVPCHRVNASDGSLAGYRWGIERKRKLQAAESKADSPRKVLQRTKSST